MASVWRTARSSAGRSAVVARERAGLGQRDRRHAVAVERREKLGVAGERAVGPLPLHEKAQAAGDRVGMRALAVGVPGAEKGQQREARHAMIALRAGAVPMMPLHRALHAAAVLRGIPAAVGATAPRPASRAPPARPAPSPANRRGPQRPRPAALRRGRHRQRARRLPWRRQRRLLDPAGRGSLHRRRRRLGGQIGERTRSARCHGARGSRGTRSAAVRAARGRARASASATTARRLRDSLGAARAVRSGGSADRWTHARRPGRPRAPRSSSSGPRRRGPTTRAEPAPDERRDDRQHGMQHHREQHAFLERLRLQPSGAHDRGDPGRRRTTASPAQSEPVPSASGRAHFSAAPRRPAAARRSPPAARRRRGRPRRPPPSGRAAPPAHRGSSRRDRAAPAAQRREPGRRGRRSRPPRRRAAAVARRLHLDDLRTAAGRPPPPPRPAAGRGRTSARRPKTSWRT